MTVSTIEAGLRLRFYLESFVKIGAVRLVRYGQLKSDDYFFRKSCHILRLDPFKAFSLVHVKQVKLSYKKSARFGFIFLENLRYV